MPSPEMMQALQQGVVHQQAGRLREAETIYRQVLAREPHNATALNLLGCLAHQVGRREAAVDLIGRAIGLQPQAADFHANLSTVHRDRKDLASATSAAARAVELEPENPLWHDALGTCLGLSGKYEQAAIHFQRAIALKPDFVAAYSNLGNVLCDLKRFDEGITAYRAAVRMQPDMMQAQYNLGRALREVGQFEDSSQCLRRAIQLNPKFAPPYNVLGNTLRDQGQFDEAIAYYQKAIELDPKNASYQSNLAIAYQDQQRISEALIGFDRSIELRPDQAQLRVYRAHCRLLSGDLERGWTDYECRWQIQGLFRPRGFPQPKWDGSNPAGKTLLLYGEQGLGDAIQFARYVPLIARRGGRVILEVRPPLMTLLQGVEGVVHVIAEGEKPPAFDAHRSLLSLPLVFDTTLKTIPAEVPYIRTDPQRVEFWRQRLEAARPGFRVGLVWAGAAGHMNDRLRSIALARFAPLAGITGVQFFSLQKGEAADQQVPAGLELTHLGSELHDLADTAALMTQLDLIISVDTSIVHLSGALARPTWNLLPHSPDWRWMLNREDTPWYLTMRLFRQPAWGDWDSVIARVAQELGTLRDSQSTSSQ